METIASEGHVLFPRRTESLLGIMLSVPGADRGPQPGSPLGVVDATGLWAWQTRPSRELRPGRYRSRYRPHPRISRFSITLCFAYYQQRFIDSLCGRILVKQAQYRREPGAALLICFVFWVLSVAANNLQSLTVRAHDLRRNDSLSSQPLSAAAQFDDPYSDFRNARYS